MVQYHNLPDDSKGPQFGGLTRWQAQGIHGSFHGHVYPAWQT